MIQTTLLKWLIGVLVVLFCASGYTAYIYHKGKIAQEQETIAQQAKNNQALQEKYDLVATQYETLKRTRVVVAQKNKQKEERLIDEHKDYYSTDVFDSASLQHIQSVQQGTDSP